MSIISLPFEEFQQTNFELLEFGTRNELYGGATQARQITAPRWRVRVVTWPVDRDKYQRWLSWWMRLKGGLNHFLLHDEERAFPLSYRDGFVGLEKAAGGSFNGTASLNARTTTMMTIAELPANFEINAGDYIGLVEDGKYGLFIASEDKTANSSGVVEVDVEPFILTDVFSVFAEVQFAKPKALFLPLAESWSVDRVQTPRPVSFSAIQVIF